MADLVSLAAARKKANDRYTKALRGESQGLIDDLASRRRALNLTQQDVADIAGVSRGQITNAESSSNDGVLSMEALLGYADAVGCRLSIEPVETATEGQSDDD